MDWPAARLCVGATVPLSGRAFELTEADEHTYQYMEERPQEYPQADAGAAIAACAAALRAGALLLRLNPGCFMAFGMSGDALL